MMSVVTAPPFFGWRIVTAAFVLAAFGWGLGFYGPPVYLHAVVQRTHWTVALVSTAMTVHFLAGAIVVASLSRLYRAFGVPVTTTFGAAVLAVGVFGWAVAAEPWHLFAAALFSGAGWVAMGAAAVNAIIAPWFVRARPAALATAYNGASVGGVVFSPLWVTLIAYLGFAWASIIIGCTMLMTIGVLSTRVFAKAPAQLDQAADGDAPGVSTSSVTSALAKPLPGARLWHDLQFLTLAGGMALGLFGQIGLLAHLFSLLVPAMGVQAAGLAMGFATLCAIVGRTLVGWMLPIGADRRFVACASYVVQVLGSFVFIMAAGHGIPLLIVGVAFFGFGIGNATSLPPLIAQVEFVEADVQRVVSLIVAIAQGTYAFAPAAFGILRTIAPDTLPTAADAGTLLFAASAVVQSLAICCFLAGRRRA